MPLPRPARRRPLWVLGLLPLLVACQSVPAAAPAPGADAAEALRRLETEIGDAACQADTDCATVAVGAKACGGPAGWRAWSRRVSDAAKVQALAQAQRDAARREVEARGLVSDCSVVADPGAQCSAGRCVPRADGRGRLVH
jgi:hypothetical protein